MSGANHTGNIECCEFSFHFSFCSCANYCSWSCIWKQNCLVLSLQTISSFFSQILNVYLFISSWSVCLRQSLWSNLLQNCCDLNIKLGKMLFVCPCPGVQVSNFDGNQKRSLFLSPSSQLECFRWCVASNLLTRLLFVINSWQNSECCYYGGISERDLYSYSVF